MRLEAAVGQQALQTFFHWFPAVGLANCVNLGAKIKLHSRRWGRSVLEFHIFSWHECHVKSLHKNKLLLSFPVESYERKALAIAKLSLGNKVQFLPKCLRDTIRLLHASVLSFKSANFKATELSQFSHVRKQPAWDLRKMRTRGQISDDTSPPCPSQFSYIKGSNF